MAMFSAGRTEQTSSRQGKHLLMKYGKDDSLLTTRLLSFAWESIPASLVDKRLPAIDRIWIAIQSDC